ncbi:hypothetical protein [Campylobacter concisus]|uniref:hypothetical protein n=1 Tax=Campylobacter concisus TaxID=199 RepID=UPI000CD91F81|nr:hypothetical protein [Campylobacter concisus]MBE9835309.1 hypothetical protein [Campylobacter concisus]MBE9856796.1 hypothetical protein [Campylobacter concisus]
MMMGAGCSFLVVLATLQRTRDIGLFKEYICSIIKKEYQHKARQKPPTLAQSEVNLSCFLHGG